MLIAWQALSAATDTDAPPQLLSSEKVSVAGPHTAVVPHVHEPQLRVSLSPVPVSCFVGHVAGQLLTPVFATHD